MLIVVLCYLLFAILLLEIERRRTLRSGPDLFTCFLGLLAIQTIIPAMVVTGTLALGIHPLNINRQFFQRVFDDLDVGTASLVMLMTLAFYTSMYVSRHVVLNVTSRFEDGRGPTYVARISMTSWAMVICVGIVAGIYLLWILGGGVDAYSKLVQFRAGSPGIERNFVSANLFALTQTFALIGVIGIAVALRKGNVPASILAIACVIFLALMTASRRALFVDILLVYFVFVIEYRHLFLRTWVLGLCAVSFPIVMYGKEFLGRIAFGGRMDFSDFGAGSLVRTAMDIGITNVESWATIMYLHEPIRLGVDHLLSVARRFPEGMLGIDVQFPERIVRVSTEAFVGANEADLPPGIFGQMWLDWGFLGPVIWGVMFGIQLGFLQRLYQSVQTTIGAKAVFVLVLFVIALPINTGSFDFTFSVDMICLVILMLMMLRVRRMRLNDSTMHGESKTIQSQSYQA